MSVANPDFAAVDWDAYVAQLPLGRIGRPVDIGEAVCWLGSDASAFVTGVDLPVDGGLTSFAVGPQPRRPRPKGLLVIESPLDGYFDAIDSGDVERTTAAFTEDALYIRPSLESEALSRSSADATSCGRSSATAGRSRSATSSARSSATAASASPRSRGRGRGGDCVVPRPREPGRARPHRRYFALMGGMPEGLDGK